MTDGPLRELRLPADALVLLVGPPGCGKSTFARRHFRDAQVVSSDECRRLVGDDAADQTVNEQAFAVFHAILRGRLSLGRLTVSDATHLQRDTRERMRALGAEHGRPVVAVAFHVPLETCLARNRGRDRVVEEEVVARFHARFQQVQRELEGEGYAAVYDVRPRTGSAPR